MTYEYQCASCKFHFDVIKSVREIDCPEFCPKCKTTATRLFIPKVLYFTNTKVESPEYNPGLGCIVRNKDHRKEICKQKGFEEIGNEPPDNIHKHFEKRREEARDRRWAEADKGWVGEG